MSDHRFSPFCRCDDCRSHTVEINAEEYEQLRNLQEGLRERLKATDVEPQETQ